MPSFGEPSGNVFFEAMAHKLPCIGAKQGATTEVIAENKCGLVVENDKDRLAEKIINLFESEGSMSLFGSNGLSAIKERYNWDVVCKNVIDVISKY